MVEALVKLILKKHLPSGECFLHLRDILTEVLSKAALSSQAKNHSYKYEKNLYHH